MPHLVPWLKLKGRGLKARRVDVAPECAAAGQAVQAAAAARRVAKALEAREEQGASERNDNSPEPSMCCRQIQIPKTPKAPSLNLSRSKSASAMAS